MPAMENVVPQKRLFVSHASNDKHLADALVDLIETGTPLDSSEIFCSSLEGLGIPSGENFIDYIKGQIQEPESVILLLTPNYYSSVFCLCEMGASWAMTHKILPLLVPPLKYEDVKGVFAVAQVDRVNNSDDLNKFVMQLIDHLSISKFNLARWDLKKKKFLKALPALLKKSPPVQSVPLATHKALQSKHDDAMDALEESDAEVGTLKEKIKALEQCKDSAEVDDVRTRFSTTLDVLDGKFKALKDSISRLPHVAAYVIFIEYLGDNAPPFPLEDRYLVQEADSAVQDEFLLYDSDDGYALNQDDPSISAAWERLDELDYFISNELSEEDFDTYKSIHGFALSLTNRRLWLEEIAERMYKF